ncbi:hypothetical protein MD484_g6600, partial [Candolleomyces efflorescens]
MVPPTNSAHLFSSNTAPKPVEVASVRQSLDHLITARHQLRAQVVALEADIFEHLVVLSPVRRIPAEIWGEIFKNVFPDHMTLKDIRNLTRICLVCKQWNDAARLTHRLWSRMSLRLSHEERTVYLPPFSKVDAWLKRSGAVPRSLKVDARDVYAPVHCRTSGTPRCSLPKALFVQLLTEGPALDELIVACSTARCFYNLLDLVKNKIKTPNTCAWDGLRSLTLSFSYNRTWNDSRVQAHSIFQGILPTSITSLHLHLPCGYMGFRNISRTRELKLLIPKALLERLTSFTIGCNWAGTQIIDAVQHCTNVEHLTIDFGMDFKGWPEDDPRIQELLLAGIPLLRLRTLRLSNGRPPAAELLKYLRAPSLVALDIVGGDPAFICALAIPLRSFIYDQSKCDSTLHHLSIEGAAVQYYEDLQILLQALPSIKHLVCRSLIFRGFQKQYRGIFETLTSPGLLPHLETLKVLDASCDYVDLEFLSAFRRTRWQAARDENGQGTLRSVAVTYQHGQDPISHCYRLKSENEGWTEWKGAAVDIGFSYQALGWDRRFKHR